MLEQWIKENANMKDRGSVAVINDDVWILPPRCFSNMPGLKKVILPYNLRKIGAFSFAGCRSLEVIDIPRQVVLIDYGAFYGCYSLKAINLPAGTTNGIKFGGLAQLARASALHAEGQRFESVILHSIGNVRNEDERSMTYCTSKQ